MDVSRRFLQGSEGRDELVGDNVEIHLETLSTEVLPTSSSMTGQQV